MCTARSQPVKLHVRGQNGRADRQTSWYLLGCRPLCWSNGVRVRTPRSCAPLPSHTRGPLRAESRWLRAKCRSPSLLAERGGQGSWRTVEPSAKSRTRSVFATGSYQFRPQALRLRPGRGGARVHHVVRAAQFVWLDLSTAGRPSHP